MKLLIPERRRRVVCVLKDRFLVSQPRACWWWVISATFNALPVTGINEQKLRRRIQELSRRHVRWGRRLVYRVFRQEGWIVNYKRVQQIWL